MCRIGDLCVFLESCPTHLSGPKITSCAGTLALCSNGSELSVCVLARLVIQGDKLVDIIAVRQGSSLVEMELTEMAYF